MKTPEPQKSEPLTSRVFLPEFLYLCQWFGKKIDPESSFGRRVIQEYFAYVRDRLDTQEFLTARAIAFDELRFLPPPKDFVALVKTDADHAITGDRIWEEVLRASRRDHLTQYDFYLGCTPQVQKALDSMGGLAAVATSDRYSLNKIARRFKDELIRLLQEEDRSKSRRSFPTSPRLAAPSTDESPSLPNSSSGSASPKDLKA